MQTDTRSCRKCGVEFSGKRCKECAKQRASEWYAANKVRHNAGAIARRKAKQDSGEWLAEQRAKNLKKKYGITPEDYDLLFRQQDGGCAICASPPADGGVLDVDHDHATGEVRGLLCSPCNRALGFFRDDLARVERASEYLARHA